MTFLNQILMVNLDSAVVNLASLQEDNVVLVKAGQQDLQAHRERMDEMEEMGNQG